MKTWKRLPAVLLLIIALLAAAVMPAAAEMLNMNDFNDGVIVVSKVPRGKAGNKISIKLTIYNNGTKDDNILKEIRLADADAYEDIINREFGSSDSDDDDDDNDNDDGLRRYHDAFPFEVDSSTFKPKDINVKPGAHKTITLSYKLRRDLPAGYYQAFFQIGETRDGKFYVGQEVGVNIWVSAYDGSSTEEDDGNNTDYDFSIGDGQFTPYAAYGQVMNFNVNLTNTGTRKVYDVRVDMQLDADVTKFPFDINEGNYNRKMGDMEPGQMVEVPYSMGVRTDVKSGFFPIHYFVTYREEEGGNFSEPVDLVFYVHVKGEDDDELAADAGEQDRTKARIIVDSFSTEPQEIYAGAPFVLKVRMKNASSNVSASNIMFTFVSEEVESSPIFTSDTGSTSMVVNSLSPGEVTELSMLFKPAPTAEQKSYRMTIQEQYDSPEFKNAKEEVKISLQVKQEPRLNTSTIEVMPDNLEVGSETNVMFGINNTGKVLLYNVMVRFEADSIQTSDTYVGNIKPGETGNVDTMVTAVAPTMDDGRVKIIISYEDENGAVTEVEKELMLFVSEAVDPYEGMEAGMMEGMDGMEGGEMEGQGSFLSKYGKIVFPIAAVLAIGAGSFIVVKRKKKKEKELEEEELDDEIS